MPSVNGYVAFFDVSVSPSSNDDNDDENDDDEGEEKEEKHDDDEERLAAFRLYLFFLPRDPPLLQPLSFLSVLSLAIHLFLSCSMNEVGRGLLRLILGSVYSFTTTFATNGGRLVISFSGRLKIRKTRENFSYT